MIHFLIALLLSTLTTAQVISDEEIDYYQEAPINEDSYLEEELNEIQQDREEELPYDDDSLEYEDYPYHEDDFLELQKMEESYAE